MARKPTLRGASPLAILERYLGEKLVKEGWVTTAQLAEARALSDERGDALTTALAELELVDGGRLRRVCSRLLATPSVNPADVGRAEPEVLALLPQEFVGEFRVIPFARRSETVFIATAEPWQLPILADVSARTGLRVATRFVEEAAVEQLLETLYGIDPARSDEAEEDELETDDFCEPLLQPAPAPVAQPVPPQGAARSPDSEPSRPEARPSVPTTAAAGDLAPARPGEGDELMSQSTFQVLYQDSAFTGWGNDKNTLPPAGRPRGSESHAASPARELPSIQAEAPAPAADVPRTEPEPKAPALAPEPVRASVAEPPAAAASCDAADASATIALETPLAEAAPNPSSPAPALTPPAAPDPAERSGPAAAPPAAPPERPQAATADVSIFENLLARVATPVEPGARRERARRELRAPAPVEPVAAPAKPRDVAPPAPAESPARAEPPGPQLPTSAQPASTPEPTPKPELASPPEPTPTPEPTSTPPPSAAPPPPAGVEPAAQARDAETPRASSVETEPLPADLSAVVDDALGRAEVLRGLRPLTSLEEARLALSEAGDSRQLGWVLARFALAKGRRVALFTRRGPLFVGWTAAGEGVAAESVRELRMVAADGSIFAAVEATGMPYMGPLVDHPLHHALVAALGGVYPRAVSLFPVHHTERVALAIYADGGAAGRLAPDVADLAILAESVPEVLERLARRVRSRS